MGFVVLPILEKIIKLIKVGILNVFLMVPLCLFGSIMTMKNQNIEKNLD